MPLLTSTDLSCFFLCLPETLIFVEDLQASTLDWLNIFIIFLRTVKKIIVYIIKLLPENVLTATCVDTQQHFQVRILIKIRFILFLNVIHRNFIGC